MKKKISELSLYRFRYQIGYLIIAMLFLSVFTLIFFIPHKLAQAEITSSINSYALSTDASDIVNLPYRLLQKVSFAILGVSTLSIKLPSILIGLTSAVMMIFLLRRWFKYNIATISAIVILSTGQFLYLSQLGAPNIMCIFFSICLVLFASLIARNATSKISLIWKILFAITFALSLYSPFFIYVALIFLAVTGIHPYARLVVKKMPIVHIAIMAVVGVVFSLPLFYGLFKDFSQINTLLGINANNFNFLDNLTALLAQLTSFSGSDEVTGVLYPAFTPVILALALIGVVRVVLEHYSAKSYFILSWLVLVIVIKLLNPAYSGIAFLPVMLLAFIGLSWVVTYWYNLFPKNPYARVVGLIPILALLFASGFGGISDYTDGYRYSPALSKNFSQDLTILEQEQSDRILLVAEHERAFFNIVTKNTTSVVAPGEDGEILVTRAALGKIDKSKYKIKKIITSSSKEQADRFYIYKKSEK